MNSFEMPAQVIDDFADAYGVVHPDELAYEFEDLLDGTYNAFIIWNGQRHFVGQFNHG